MARRRVQQIEAVLICIGGILLILEICNAVRSNVWWIGRSVLAEQRFAFYLWTGVSIGVLFVIEGVTSIRRSAVSMSFVAFQAPFILMLLPALIIVAHGWRIRTDVAPADGISALSDLPATVRILADPWLAGSLITMVTVGAAAAAVKPLRRRPHMG